MPPPISDELNLIQAKHKEIAQRKSEFYITKINLDHIASNKQSNLMFLHENYSECFYSSLKMLGHTDNINSEIQFNSKYPIKAFPYSMPKSLKVEAERSINELLEAEIIAKNFATWAYLMLMVKNKMTIVVKKIQNYA